MKNNSIYNRYAFTLIEIVVAITISVLIMGGLFSFLTKLQNDIMVAKQSTLVHTNLTDFIGSMQNFNKLYASGSIIVGGTGVYNVSLLTKPDKTTGVLIWVVEKKVGNLSKLDPVVDKGTYGEKVIAYQKLTASQINTISSNTGTVYDVIFLDEWLFHNLTVSDFSITPYNSGNILEYGFDVETPFYKELEGKPKNKIDPNSAIFSFTLDF